MELDPGEDGLAAFSLFQESDRVVGVGFQGQVGLVMIM